MLILVSNVIPKLSIRLISISVILFICSLRIFIFSVDILFKRSIGLSILFIFIRFSTISPPNIFPADIFIDFLLLVFLYIIGLIKASYEIAANIINTIIFLHLEIIYNIIYIYFFFYLI